LIDANRYVGVFDVDEDGVLYVLDGETVKLVDRDSKPADAIKLQMGDASPGRSSQLRLPRVPATICC
jgi:hypothetical protein